jgi:gamma-glutamyl:cysteine ligase YbdK (ATP-grasp superfamily)
MSMGQEIGSASFSKAERQAFRRRLADETRLLAERFAQGRLSTVEHVGGAELEAWLVDPALDPAPLNDRFLARFEDELCGAELGRFNIEFNTAPAPLRGRFLSGLQRSLDAVLARARETAGELDLDILVIGALPTLRDDQLNLGNLSPLNRYRALNEQVFAARHGEPIRLDIAGRQELRSVHCDVMLEAAATSFQLHWQLSAADAARYYNAALVASAPVLAVSVNSPYLFQRDLWAETRIPLFEQAVAVPGYHATGSGALARVGFGSGWVRGSLLELFDENRDEFPVLLPVVAAADPEQFVHLRLHNGTIWRWNRPVVGFDPDGRPHLRLEHRALPAGPTTVDMVASAALFFGLVQSLVVFPPAGPEPSFSDVKTNFYAAAREGLGALLRWFGGREVAAREVVRQMIDAAGSGLTALGVEPSEIDRYLAIIEARCATGRTGSDWQRRFIQRYPGQFTAMTREYLQRQKSGLPVHEWAL